MMPIVVELCTEPDIDRVFHIISDSFGHTQPFIDTLFPRHDTPEGYVLGRDRLLEQMRTDSGVRFTKALDSETGQIIGQANWLILEEKRTDVQPEDDPWGDAEDKEHAQQLFAQYMVPRSKAFHSANGKIVALELLSVDPKHQSNGVGSILTKWGVDFADKLGYDAVVESTVNAVAVYEKHGFRAVNEMVFEFAKKFESRPKPHLLFMRRSANFNKS